MKSPLCMTFSRSRNRHNLIVSYLDVLCSLYHVGLAVDCMYLLPGSVLTLRWQAQIVDRQSAAAACILYAVSAYFDENKSPTINRLQRKLQVDVG